MEVGKFSTLLYLLFLNLLVIAPAQALIDVPTFRLGLGYSSLSFTAGSVVPTSTSLGTKLTLNPMFLWDIPKIRSRLGFHFQTDLGSQYGFVSTAGVGITGLLYPLGLSSSREVRDDFSEVVKTRVSPYIQFGITPTSFAVTIKPTDPNSPILNSPTSWPYFNVMVIETSIGVGIDYPVSDDLVGFVGLHYRTASYVSQEVTAGAARYSGIELLLGTMTNFY